MPRRSNNLTPSDTTGTPTDNSATPADQTPLPLPKPPVIPRPPRLPPPGPPGARPGRRGETPSDMTLTGKIQRVPRGDPTPAPLPPSPGARDAERWFEQVPTNPAAQPSGQADVTASHRKSGRMDRSGLTAIATPRPEIQWVVLFLVAAIALTIGMILGALVFSHSGSKTCEPCDKTPAAAPQPKQ